MKCLPLICVLIIMISSLFSIEQVFNSTDVLVFCKASQNETWLIKYNQIGGTIYDENFEPLCTFTLPETGTKIICQVGRDFDSDNNIEILYQVTITPGNATSTYLKDLTTGVYELAFIGSNGNSFISNDIPYLHEAHYLHSERVFIIRNYTNTPNPYAQNYMLYTSGVIAPP